MSVINYKLELRTALLDFAWRQWGSIGLSSQNQLKSEYVVDPEALLLFSCHIARYDQRLFDEIIDWLLLNGRLINVQRLKKLAGKAKFECKSVLSMMVEYLKQKDKSSKWKTIAEVKNHDEEPLFRTIDGKDVITNGASDSVALKYGFKRNVFLPSEKSMIFTNNPASTLLRLRALFGVCSRAEVIAFLLARHLGSTQNIAHWSTFSWKSIQDVILDLEASGTLGVITNGRNKAYQIITDDFSSFRSRLKLPSWIDLFNALAVVMDFFDNPVLEQLAPPIVEANLKQKLFEVNVLFFNSDISDFFNLNVENIKKLPQLLSEI